MGAALSLARRASVGTCHKQGVLAVILILSNENSEVHNTYAAVAEAAQQGVATHPLPFGR